MYKEYFADYFKKNKASCATILVAAFISALFLSLITGVFYNMWKDNINKVITNEGDWHVRITEDLSEDSIQKINNYVSISDVKKAEVNSEQVVYLYFNSMRDVYEDMPDIAELAGIDMSEVTYHDTLLSEYFVYDPNDETPPLLLLFYVLVMAIVCISLVMIIKNAFLVTMNSRMHQIGILQSVGATPRQIKKLLIFEAAVLSVIPIIVGMAMGLAGCVLIIRLANYITEDLSVKQARFYFNPAVVVISLLVSFGTVLYSAWLPARKLSRRTPLEVLKGTDSKVKKVKKYRILKKVFGIEGELAYKSLYVRRKSIRTASISLTLSLLAFSIFLCFISLSRLSTQYTYFERYKDSWDVMVETDVTDMGSLPGDEIADINGVESSTLYQLADGHISIAKDDISDELVKAGGLKKIAETAVTEQDDTFRIKSTVLVLDDEAFDKYCSEIGIKNQDGTVVINRIWNRLDSNFRYKEYIPYVNEEMTQIQFESNSVNIIGYTDVLPDLREEYDNYSLVQVASYSYWTSLNETSMKVDTTYINIKTDSDDAISQVETDVEDKLQNYKYDISNRIDEKESNDKMLQGYILILGGLCSLLSIIGIANVFSNTLGLMNNRRREFARYMSIGVTPLGIRKIIVCEALVTGLKPVIVTVPICIVFVIFAAKASYISVSEAFESVPVGLLIGFAAFILACVGLAYYLGAKKLYKGNLIDMLKNDTEI